LVFYAGSGQFDQAFRSAEAAIYKQLVESSPTGDYGVVYSSLRIGGWTAFLAMGISLALIMGQNSYMHLPILTLREGSISTLGSLAAGMVAGGAGQLLFVPLTNIPIPIIVEGIMHWSVASAVSTGVMSFTIPKLKKLKLPKAIVAGGISGGPAIAIGLAAIAAGTAIKSFASQDAKKSTVVAPSMGASPSVSSKASGSTYQYGGSSYSTQSMKLSIDLTGSITSTQTGYSINKSLETTLRVTGR
jgi:hypothetical protein